MQLPHLLAVVTPSAARSLRHWFLQLGGLGLIPLGLLDSSLLPIPGSMDLLTILLSARDQTLWPWYALMATVGSVVGAYITYRLARKGEKAALERRISPARLDRVYKTFERWGFAAIAIPALLPPPVPMVPFVLAAGAMQYSLKKFLAAMTLGRAIRYALLAFLGARYGRHIFALILRHARPVLLGTLVFAAVATAAFFLLRAVKSRNEAHRPSSA